VGDPVFDDFGPYASRILADPARVYTTEEVLQLDAVSPPVASPVSALVDRYEERRDPALRPPGARLVRLLAVHLPAVPDRPGRLPVGRDATTERDE